jgi:hypothetical protein
MCREHVLQLQQIQWETLNLQVIMIAFEEPDFVRLYRDQAQIQWPIISDPQRQLYQTFGMQRATVTQVINWQSLKGYLSLVFGRGRKVHWPSNHDYLQLGGDVVVDPTGIVRVHHLSQSPEDRPNIAEIQRRVSSQQ